MTRLCGIAARKEQVRLPGCTHVGDCRNCLVWALVWRERVLRRLREPARGATEGQLAFDLGAVA